jgi:hypothetical protein
MFFFHYSTNFEWELTMLMLGDNYKLAKKNFYLKPKKQVDFFR